MNLLTLFRSSIVYSLSSYNVVKNRLAILFILITRLFYNVNDDGLGRFNELSESVHELRNRI